MQKLLRVLKGVWIPLLLTGGGYLILAYSGQILFALMIVGAVIVLIDGIGSLTNCIRRKMRGG